MEKTTVPNVGVVWKGLLRILRDGTVSLKLTIVFKTNLKQIPKVRNN
jgi:hypothetical protein